jgi:hypothetical protein
MFGKFICVKYLNTGKCNDSSCTLKHVNDITSMEVSSVKRGAEAKTEKKSSESSSSWVHVGGASAASVRSKMEAELKDGSMVTFKSRGSTFASRKEEEKKASMKKTQCKFLFEKGTCRMGDRCYFSHEGFDGKPRPSTAVSRTYERPMRGGFRGRGSICRRIGSAIEGGSHYEVPPEVLALIEEFDREDGIRGGYRGGFRGGRGGRGGRDFFGGTTGRGTSEVVKLVRPDNDDLDITDFNNQLKKMYSELVRIEPIRRALYAGKELDMMFIIDCTGSMGCWIEACKREIKAIIDCVRNQHFNI